MRPDRCQNPHQHSERPVTIPILCLGVTYPGQELKDQNGMPSNGHAYFSSRLDRGVLCVTFQSHDLVLGDVPGLDAELVMMAESVDPPRLVLSLDNVRYLPTTALGIMVSKLTRSHRKQGEMHLACLNEHLDELMHIGRLDQIFEIHDTAEEALASLVTWPSDSRFALPCGNPTRPAPTSETDMGMFGVQSWGAGLRRRISWSIHEQCRF